MKAYIEKQNVLLITDRICRPMKECPSCAITWVEDADEPLGSRMEIDYEKCDGCGICVEICCGGCIVLK